MENSVYFNFFSDLNTIFSLPIYIKIIAFCLRWLLLLLKENSMSSRECGVCCSYHRGKLFPKSANNLWLSMPMLDLVSRGSRPLIGELLPGIQ